MFHLTGARGLAISSMALLVACGASVDTDGGAALVATDLSDDPVGARAEDSADQLSGAEPTRVRGAPEFETETRESAHPPTLAEPAATTAPAVEQAPLAAASTPLRIMTVNIREWKEHGDWADPTPNRWYERRARIATMIKGWAPDLIAVQEAFDVPKEELDDLLDAQVPGGYYWVSLPRISHSPLDGSMVSDPEMLVTFVKNSRLTVESVVYRHTDEDDRDNHCPVGYRDRNYSDRPILGLHVRDRLTGKHLYSYNAHFPSGNGCQRLGMADRLVDFMYTHSLGFGWPSMALGDFNAGIAQNGELNESFSRLLTKADFRNPYAWFNCVSNGCAFRTEANGFNKTERWGDMIDHILLSPTISATGSWIDRTLINAQGQPVPCKTISTVAGVTMCTGTNYQPSQLQHYSDHWAVITDIVMP